jgi:hypothetical protein
MRAVRRTMAALSLVAVIASGSALAGMRDDDSPGRQVQKASKHRNFIQRILDYLDNKLSVPPT